MTAIENRYDFVFLFDVQDGNPNGDPDAGNLPRTDPEDGRGLVTDVCLKRKVRNWVHAAKNNDPPHAIYIMDAYLRDQQKAAFRALDIPAATNKTHSEQAREWMCQNFFDVRTFGAVMSTGTVEKGDHKNSKGQETRLGKQEKWMWNCGQVLGPVQMIFARSIDRVATPDHTITRRVKTNPSDEVADQEGRVGEMGRKATVPYGLYRTHGFVNVPPARKTGFGGDDLALFWEALLGMFDLDRSAARGLMAARRLIVFKHESALGNAPAAALFERVRIERRNGDGPPRSFADYAVTVDEAGLPAGVTVQNLL